MPFVKTTSNTNGSIFTTNDMDTVTLRNIAIADMDTITKRNLAINDMDTITLRNLAINDMDTITKRNLALVDMDTITKRNLAINDMDTITLRNLAINDMDTITKRNIAITDMDTITLRNSSLTSLLNSGTFNTINVTNLNILTSTSKNIRLGFQAGLLNTSGSNNTTIGNGCLQSWVIGTYNTAIGVNCTGFSGNNNTLLGSSSNSSGNYDNSSCLGCSSSITQSNQIALGRISETVQVRGGFSTSVITLSTTSTLSNPILTNYICINGSNNITLTFSTPPESGLITTIRRGASSTGTITISYNSIFPVNSIISSSSLNLVNTSSFLYYNNAWYQTTSF